MMQSVYSMNPKSKVRLKDLSEQQKKIREGLSENTLNFLEEAENYYGNRLRLTSGKRNASQKIGSHSNVSKHNIGEAFDIGAEHDDFYYQMLNTPQGLEIMARYNFGAIDETNPTIKAKNKATGDHFHFGTDSFYAKQAKDRNVSLKSGVQIQPLVSYRALQRGIEPNAVINTEVIEKANANNMELPEGELVDFEKYALEMKIEQQANNENPDREALIQEDYKIKSDKMSLQNIISMFDEINSSPTNTNYTVGGDGIYSGSVSTPTIENQDNLTSIFTGGYNG